MPLHAMRFRSSPNVELKQLSELDGGQRERFLELEEDPDFYGLLVAKPPLVMNIKSVAKETAELFRSLAEPSLLDPNLLGDHDLADLVLDGILEVEGESGFVSGADALALVVPPTPIVEPRDAVARLSIDALLHAQDLETTDAWTLAMALYLYNRIPLSPFWRARFADADAVLAQLGADGGSLRAALDRDWVESRGAAGWISWSAKSAAPHKDSDPTWKLYVSPRPERIRDAFEIVVRVLSRYPETHFKIGNDAAGLLRPDKLVAYFATAEGLRAVADELRRELAGCEAHGIPFTAGLDDAGLLSWGIDPPDDERALRWLQRQSWRLWIAQRLGAALAVARSSRGASVVPWRFALERARRHGVDVETWTPSATLWSAS